ncbi:MAG: hypothetical protein R3A79_04260 [Nannocystaceae bacterium]
MLPPLLQRLACGLSVLTLLAACGEEPKPELSPERKEQVELADLADGLAKSIDDNLSDCKKMGAAMAAWKSEHGERFDALRQKHAKLPGDEWSRWNLMTMALNRAQACVGNPMLGMDDPEVKRVLGELNL